MQLPQGTLLQGGKYQIEREFGQGGFGITYLGEQTSLGRKVAIKEFFMKELCNRDEATSHVSVGSEGSREMVAKFREKFVKEARNIASLKHPNIVSVIDVFEENGTAYYVMDYCEGGSLSSMLKDKYPQGMPEPLALQYIRQIASALDYIHKRSINHLDVKPANIMLDEAGEAILIDFGLSKQYDAETGSQTSSTPVGISEGYAPMEQYKKGGVSEFSPSTDIYALGATLYKLLTGLTPPNANDVLNSGLPALPSSVSAQVSATILAAMQPRKADRHQSIAAFIAELDGESEVTVLTIETETKSKHQSQSQSAAEPQPKPSKSKPVLYGIIAAAVIALCILLFRGFGGGDDPVPPMQIPDIVAVGDTVPTDTVQEEPSPAKPAPQEETQEPEAAGYDVTFTCNVPSATLYIDGKASGSANDTHFLKTGNHAIKVTAEGYKDYTRKIAVNSQTQPYTIKMTEEPKPAVVSAQEPKPEPAVPSANATTGTHRGHEWVDLGLPSGTKWATMNVGASSPGDYGSYFAWGETSTSYNYAWGSYKWSLDTTGDKFSKYVIDSKYGNVDGKKELELSDDAAHVNWGPGWRMPSRAQQDELREKCKWTWTSQGGHNGYKVVGPNGNFLFLPAACCWYGSIFLSVGSDGYYWSRTLPTIRGYSAYYLYFNSSNVDWSIYNRCNGQSVRAVRSSE